MIFADVPRDRPWVRFFAAPPALQGLVSGFNVYGTYGLGAEARETYFPGWTTIRFNFTGKRLRAGRHGEAKTIVPPAVLYGPSSHQFEFSGIEDGISLGLGVTPLGFWRLLGRPADSLTDRMACLDEFWPDAGQLHRSVAECSDCQGAIDLLAEYVSTRLAPPIRDAGVIAELMNELVGDGGVGVGQLSQRMGRSPRLLQRVALKHFGFPIKLLLRRSRFLRTLHAIYGTPPGTWSQLLGPSYHDQSQFIRDSHDFLGMTPGEFLRQDRPMHDLSIRQRAKAMGAPYMALQSPG